MVPREKKVAFECLMVADDRPVKLVAPDMRIQATVRGTALSAELKKHFVWLVAGLFKTLASDGPLISF